MLKYALEPVLGLGLQFGDRVGYWEAGGIVLEGLYLYVGCDRLSVSVPS
jgi:hypothetical protein